MILFLIINQIYIIVLVKILLDDGNLTESKLETHWEKQVCNSKGLTQEEIIKRFLLSFEDEIKAATKRKKCLFYLFII